MLMRRRGSRASNGHRTPRERKSDGGERGSSCGGDGGGGRLLRWNGGWWGLGGCTPPRLSFIARTGSVRSVLYTQRARELSMEADDAHQRAPRGAGAGFSSDDGCVYV